MRKLASIQTVNAAEPIPNADAIEKIRVLGWWVVTKKGEFKPGDKVVYCEIDSLLPETADFEFLRPNCFKPARTDAAGAVVLPSGFRIKTIKLRGQVSQGICFPLNILPAGAPTDEDADVTDALGVCKWEPPQTGASGRARGSFPGFLPKTDETRVQVLEKVLERYQGVEFYLTEKLDGTSFTAFIREGEFGVCSRNMLLDTTDPMSTLVGVAKRLNLEERLRALGAARGFEVAVQGEIIGPGVQQNKYALKEVALRVFNVFDVSAYRFLDHADVLTAIAEMGLEAVPQLGTLVLSHGVDELVALSEGMSVLNAKAQREGIVLRPLREVDDHYLGRLSFKAINPKFLLKYDE
ncbi:RNA ligase, DRB0094 family OS=Planctomyces limnophilus (strain ATCC 43296 / DSM 3776 / IFAM 1008 / 290) GN=Plim_0508 PE=4 SV=1: RNA_ligase [Gemmata massiliana]|uniref:RNA ligase domain-containing protein n=1 Tax=Gemmata massiliana TaxID=1210884 RepID=A0A6P2D307_9BACT|nr:RNA ligase (ATP) [Gemmata massiliana]VTR94896.1 RNA ligase, DRB0094 family OS=Planctomyces limnophilus (strain ATCC 43296 / DSM 3776 / IFAM 1008 / 290) GN=Plim_0508 PE=4 SV=1: RNA_ligase [Gemmata massiliana]